MPITLYRGESRTPIQIRDAGGFSAKLQLPTAGARAVVVRAAIDPTENVTGFTGQRISQIIEYLIQNPGLTGFGPLYQQIKKEREASSIHVSTETTTGGGGMGGGYTYRIVCPTPQYEWSPSHGGTMSGVATPPQAINVDADLTAASIRSFLLTDNDGGNVARAAVTATNIVALYNPAQTVKEVAFLTPIPYAWITDYRQGTGAWIAMP